MKSKVTVSFENETDAEYFRKTLQNVKDQNMNFPSVFNLFNSLLVPILLKASTIEATSPEWDAVHDGIDADARQRALTDMDVFTIWKAGLQSWIAVKHLGAHFPHES